MKRWLILLLLVAFVPTARSAAQITSSVAFPNLSFERPVDMTTAPGGNRLYVVEQFGTIRSFENETGATSADIFLDIRDRVRTEHNEEGLLGLAFHPDYVSNGYFYVFYSASNPTRSVLSRFSRSTSDPDVADPASELVLLEFEKPFGNHNGGQIRFGDDGYLYISTGDGGNAGDPFKNAQNRTNLLGKILRIDVDNPMNGENYGIPDDNPFADSAGLAPEIYAYGLRNPWRFSIDPVTDWLWTADAGQDAIEEVNIIFRGGNYGWDIMEGSGCFEPSIRCDSMAEAMGLKMPIYDYTHRLGDVVTSGYVYRGTRIPSLQGKYVFADFSSGRLWALEYDQSDTSLVAAYEVAQLQIPIAAFGVDAANELYILGFDGRIHGLSGTATAPPSMDLDLRVAFPNLTFERPVDMATTPGDENRLFVVEQGGIIRAFENSPTVSETQTFLDISDRVSRAHNEEGLLGLAFHPQHSSNGLIYVFYSASNPRRSVLSSFARSTGGLGNVDPSSEVVLLEFEKPFGNHNGGQLAFGDDGYLYLTTGDGGDAGDPFQNAQNRTNLLGKMLRIDVNTRANGANYGIPADNPYVDNDQGWREEIYAYGLRNPWRFSIDRETDWIWTADAGQDAIEEIDIIFKGENYGWDIMEGSGCFEPKIRCDSMAEAMGLAMPIYDYTHRLGSAIISGHVYRGTDIPELQGKYIFADFSSGRIWALEYQQSDTSLVDVDEIVTLPPDQALRLGAFGQDADNEIYILALDGKIYTLSTGASSVATTGSTLSPLSVAPNPSSGSMEIGFSLDRSGEVRVELVSMLGEQVTTIEEKAYPEGRHHVRLNGADRPSLTSGTYFVRVTVDGEMYAMRKVIVQR